MLIHITYEINIWYKSKLNTKLVYMVLVDDPNPGGGI